MTCPIITSDQRICEFSVTYALNSFMTGRVKFVDCNCEDSPGCDEPCKEICVQIQADLKTDALEPAELAELEDCYENPPKWLNGLIESHGFNYGDSISSLGVVPYHNYLHNKPISTEQFCGENVRRAIEVSLLSYSGLSPNVFSVDPCLDFDSQCRIKGPVEGNNTLTEIAKLAQAGCASLFTQVGGDLVVECWKDHESDVEFEIPCEYILSAQKAEFNPSRISGVLMRGAEVNTIDCGDNSLTNNEQGPGPTKKCVFSGIKTPSVDVKFNNLSGSAEDINNATVISSGDNGQTVSDLMSTGNGTATGAISAADGSQIGCTPECVNIQITGKNANQSSTFQNGTYIEQGSSAYGGYGWGSNKPAPFNSFNRMINNFFPIPYYMFGLGEFTEALGPNNNTNTNGNRPDQPSRSQCETFITTEENNQCGNGFEDHENRYVFSKDQLFKIGIRRMQELKMADNAWNIELPYLPCLKINQVVTFDTPATKSEDADEDAPGCPAKTIKGIVAAINLDHRKTSENELPTTMKAVVLDTECLGKTRYCSGNLLGSMCGHSGASEISPWQAAEYNLDQGSGVNGCAFLFGAGDSFSFLNYTHEKLLPECEYTISYDWQFVQGGGKFDFVYTAGSDEGNDTHIGNPSLPPDNPANSGSYSSTFTPDLNPLTGETDDVLTFSFEMLDPPSPTYLKIYNLSLTAKCLA